MDWKNKLSIKFKRNSVDSEGKSNEQDKAISSTLSVQKSESKFSFKSVDLTDECHSISQPSIQAEEKRFFRFLSKAKEKFRSSFPCKAKGPSEAGHFYIYNFIDTNTRKVTQSILWKPIQNQNK